MESVHSGFYEQKDVDTFGDDGNSAIVGWRM